MLTGGPLTAAYFISGGCGVRLFLPYLRSSGTSSRSYENGSTPLLFIAAFGVGGKKETSREKKFFVAKIEKLPISCRLKYHFCNSKIQFVVGSTIMSKDLTIFFEKLNLVVEKVSLKKKDCLQRGEQFNIIQIAGLTSSELFHSSFIAQILNPQGSHGQGDSFLQLFLSKIPEIGETLLLPFETSSASVYTEYVTPEGRIDILITNNAGQAIIIENKIYALEQPDQIKRYQKYASDKFGKGNYVVIYLSLFGSDSETVDKSKTYLPISYKDDIATWIEACIRNSAKFPGIREVFIQYEQILNILTNQIMDQTDKNELLELLMEKPEVSKAIYSVQSEYVVKAVRDKLMPELKRLCESEGFKLCGEEDFVNSISQVYVGFSMTPVSWKTYELSLECDSRYWGAICIGVHRKDCDEKGEKCAHFKCLPKANDLWCGGWIELPGKYSHFSYDTVPEIISGAFADEIMKVVRQIKDEAVRFGYIM